MGYKDINLATEQAPAILDVVTGQSRRLENYVDLCGQPAFVGNNAVCYTIGSKLVVRNLDGSDRREYPMPEYAINPAGTIAAFGTHDGAFYIMSLADGSVTRIPELDGGYNPQWSNDGTQIAMLCESGLLLTYDINARKRCNLSYANDFCWADNSKTLVYSSVRLSADEQILGASVIASAWDGSQSVKLVNETTDLPTAVLCSGNTLLTSYAMNGDRALRKTAIRRSANGIAATHGRTVQMLSFAEGLAPNQTQYLNDQRASRVLARVEGTKLTIWFNVFAQGLACYQYNSDQTGIEDIMTDDADSDIEYYTIQGIRVHSDNLTPGLYIRRQGNKATKVLIR